MILSVKHLFEIRSHMSGEEIPSKKCAL